MIKVVASTSTYILITLSILFIPNTLLASVIGISTYKIKGGLSKDQFEDKLSKVISKASSKKIEILLLPELITFDLFPVNPSKKEIKSNIELLVEYQQRYSKFLQKQARINKITILGASNYIKDAGKTFNAAFIVFPDKPIQSQYKNYPTPWEIKYGIQRSKGIKLFKYKDLNFSVLICHDVEFPNLSMELAKKNIDIIFVPSMTDDENGYQRVLRTSQARAIEQMVYVALTGTKSELEKAPWNSYVGHSNWIKPKNKYFNSDMLSDDLLIINLNKKDLIKSRKDLKQVYPARDI